MDISNVLYGITLGTYVDGISRELYLGKMTNDLVKGILDAGPMVPASLRALAKRYKAVLSDGRITVPAEFKAKLNQEALVDLIDTDLLLIGDLPGCRGCIWDDLDDDLSEDDNLDDDPDEDLDDLDEDEDMDDVQDEDKAPDVQFGGIPPHTIHIDDVDPAAIKAILPDYHIVCDSDGYLVCLLPRHK